MQSLLMKACAVVAVFCPLQAVAQQLPSDLPTVMLDGTFGNDYQRGTVTIVDGGDTTRLAARIKWRGGTTNTPDKHKRNYKIKLDDDARLFGLRKDDSWILDAGQADLFRLRNRIATELWNDFARKPYYYADEPDARSGVRGKVVELYLNGEYRGIYAFTEAMDRKELRLKKFSGKTIHGQLWKSDDWGMSQMYRIPTQYDNSSDRWESFELKYPDNDDLSPSSYSTLADAIRFVAAATDQSFKANVASFFDLPVLEDYYIFLHVTNAVDNRGKNLYWAVYDRLSYRRLTLAVWDLDKTMGARPLSEQSADDSSPCYDMPDGMRLFDRLRQLDAGNFNEHVAERYAACRRGVLSDRSLMQRFERYYVLLHYNGADRREEQLWSGDSDVGGHEIDLAAELAYIKDWISRHMAHLDSLFLPTTGIVRPVAAAADPATYTLQGVRVKPPLRPGVYIRNRKKFVVR